MIDKKLVESVVNEWLADKDYFLVDVSVSADDCIVVTIDHAEGVWIEDCASAMTQMHLMADALGIGSCWLQVRLRTTPDGTRETQAVIRELLGIPEKCSVLAILTLGMPASHPAPHTVEELPLNKIHYEHF